MFGNEWVGLGAVLRNHNGGIVAAGVVRLKAKWQVTLAEMTAARWGLIMASHLGLLNIEIETDALEVVKYFHENLKIFSPVGLILEDIYYLSSMCSSFSFTHVKRKGNSAAHVMARITPNFGNDCIYLSNFPQGIITLAEKDFS